MREQVQRLNKRPGAEVQSGQLATGVTGSVNMPFVQQQKTKGQRLAETFGMVVEGGTKIAQQGVELYEGQKKEEAANRIAQEQFQWMDEMNNLNSDADRVQYIQNKVKEVSTTDVDENYRNMTIGFFDNYYNTYSKGAVKEKNTAVSNILTNELYSNMLTNKTVDYDKTVARYSHLPKSYYHNAYQQALSAYAVQRLSLDKTKSIDDLRTAKADIDTLVSEYKNNPFAGGSKAVDAVELQTKFNKLYDTSLKTINKQFTDQHNLEVEKLIDNPVNTVEAFKKKNKQAVEMGLMNELDEYKKNKEYIKARATYEDVEETKVVFYNNTADIGNNWSSLSKESKTWVTDATFKNLEFSIQGGFWTSAASLINDIPEAGKPFLTSRFSYTQDPEEIKGELETYKGLRSTYAGRNALSLLDKNDRVMFEILNTDPKANPESIQEFINLKKDGGAKFSFGEDRMDAAKDWSKVKLKIPLKDRAVAESLRDYHYAKYQDTDAAIKYVRDNFAKDLTVEVGTPNLKGFKKVDVSGFETEEKAEYYLNALTESLGEYAEFDSIVKNPDGTIDIVNSEFPLDKGQITQKELDKLYARKLMEKTDADTLDYQDFIEELSVLRNNVSDYMDNWVEVAADGGWVQTASYAIPIGVTLKSAKEGYRLYKWMKDTGAVGDLVLDLSSKVVSRANLQKASDLLQKAGYNVKIANKGKSFKVSKKRIFEGGVGIGAALGLALQGDAEATEVLNNAAAEVQKELGVTDEEIIDGFNAFVAAPDTDATKQEILKEVEAVENLSEDEQIALVRNLVVNFGEVNEYGSMMSPEEEAEIDAYVENTELPMTAMLDTEGESIDSFVANDFMASQVVDNFESVADTKINSYLESLDSDAYLKYATEHTYEYEGYSESGVQFNVPAPNKSNSGLTIGGLDIPNYTGNVKDALAILKKILPTNKYNTVASYGGLKLKGKKAKEYLDNNPLNIKLTEKEIKDIQITVVKEKYKELQKRIPQNLLNKLDAKVKGEMIGVMFLNTGPNSIDAVKKGLKTNKQSDWKKAYDEYKNYGWKTPSSHNEGRTDRVAEAIKEAYL